MDANFVPIKLNDQPTQDSPAMEEGGVPIFCSIPYIFTLMSFHPKTLNLRRWTKPAPVNKF